MLNFVNEMSFPPWHVKCTLVCYPRKEEHHATP
jgi:hypothetical protein